MMDVACPRCGEVELLNPDIGCYRCGAPYPQTVWARLRAKLRALTHR